MALNLDMSHSSMHLEYIRSNDYCYFVSLKNMFIGCIVEIVKLLLCGLK